jgi:DNA-binding NtrC family response regulator
MRIVVVPETTALSETRRDPLIRYYNEPFPHPMQPLLPLGRILLVDEEEKDLKYFATLLGRMGYSFRAYTDDREAEERLGHEHFDLIIVSLSSPAFETHCLIEIASARTRHIPVVVLTRCLEMSCYLEAMQRGAADSIEKPAAPEEFERVVATHCLPPQSEVFAAND